MTFYVRRCTHGTWYSDTDQAPARKSMTPTRLRIGTLGLDPWQAIHVRVVIRQASSTDEHFPWTFADAAPFDALILGPDKHTDLPADLGVRGGRVLALPRRAAAAAEGTPPWPLRSEQLLGWLAIQAYELRGDSPPLPSTAATVEAPPRATPRFRLLRWPPAALLQRDPRRIRMATVMAARPMSVEELVQASEQTVDRCADFLRVLHGFGLLEVDRGRTPQRASPAAVQGHAGLVHSIRRRLGLHS